MSRVIYRWTLVLAFLLFVSNPSSALAAGPEEIFRTSDAVRIASGETVAHDLYLAAQTITIDGTVQGDVAAGAQTVVVNGTIEGDLWAGAESVTVTGRVRGDLRVGVNALSIDGEIGRNVLVFGNEASITAQGRIAGDLIAYTASTNVGGQVGGDVAGETATYENTGRIGGRELIRVSPADSGELETPAASTPAQLVLGMLEHWVSILVVGGILALLWRGGMLNASSFIVRRPLASLGSGALVLIGGIVAIIAVLILLIIVAIVLGSLGLGGLTAFSVVGLLLTDVVITVGLVLGATFVAGALLSLAVGRVILQGRSGEGRLNVLLWLALGTVLYVVIGALPVIGGWVQFVVALVGLGALGLAFWEWRRRDPTTSPPPPPTEAVAA